MARAPQQLLQSQPLFLDLEVESRVVGLQLAVLLRQARRTSASASICCCSCFVVVGTPPIRVGPLYR